MALDIEKARWIFENGILRVFMDTFGSELEDSDEVKTIAENVLVSQAATAASVSEAEVREVVEELVKNETVFRTEDGICLEDPLADFDLDAENS